MPGRLRKLSSSVFPQRGQREDPAPDPLSSCSLDLSVECSNPNLHSRDEDCLRSEDVCFAREWYVECWRSSRKKELPPWECRIETFFPHSSSWRSPDPLDESITALAPNDAKDRLEDTHWAFGSDAVRRATKRDAQKPLSPTTTATNTTAANPTEPQSHPAPKHEDNCAPDASASATSSEKSPAASLATSAPTSAPRLGGSRAAAAKQRAAGEHNWIRHDEAHINHIDDPVGCACDHCIDTAGLDSLGPLEVVDKHGHVVELEPVAFCSSPIGIDDGQTSSKNRSAASSVKSNSPRKHGLGGFFDGIKRSSTSTAGSVGRLRDSGYASSTRMDSH